MNQLLGLMGLKWKLALRQVRGGRALLGALLLGLVGLLILLASLAASVGMFVSLYSLALHANDRLGGMTVHALLMLYLAGFYMIWLMTALMPTRGGGSVETPYLLHYPIPLRRLFVLDLVSELAKGVTLPLLPPLLAVCLALPAAAERWWWGLPPFVLSLVLGATLLRTGELLIARVSLRGRSQGEQLAALGAVILVAVILVAGVSGARVMSLLERSQSWQGELLRLLPLSITAQALLAAHKGQWTSYVQQLAGLLGWVMFALTFCYALWQQLTLGVLSAGRSTQVQRAYEGWRVPGLSSEQSALVEQAIRYMMRNSQVLALFVLGLTVLIFKVVGQLPQGGKKGDESSAISVLVTSGVFEGLDVALMVSYTVLFYFALYNNLFGLDGHGFKALMLSPVRRLDILLSRNIALAVLVFLQGSLLLAVTQLLFGDVTLLDVGVMYLGLTCLVAMLGGVGNFVSIYFPRRSVFGSKLTTSPWGVLFLLVEAPLCLAPLGVAFGVSGGMGQSWLLLPILLSCALLYLGCYAFLLLPLGAEALERREQALLNTLVGGDE